MKIAFVGNIFKDMINFRGEVIKSLAEKGHTVTIVVPENRDKTCSYNISDYGIEKMINVPLNRKGINPLEDLKYMIRLINIYKREKFDLSIHYTIKPNIYGSIAAKFVGIKSIAVTTGLGYSFINNSFSARIARLLYRVALIFTEKVLFLNENDKDIFIGKKIIKNGKEYVINGEGINTHFFSPAENGKKREKIVFLMIARVLWDKGFREYYEAAREIKKQNKEIEFWLLGGIDSGNPAQVSEKQVRDLEAEGIIKYLGVRHDVRNIISESDCVVLPSYREGLSRVLMEAASMAKPIVATDVPGCREIIKDGKNGFLCKAKDAESLAESMKKIICMSEENRKAMGKEGRNIVLEQFDVKKICDEYVKLISEL